ncbi:MAG TPA: hypothetical protein VEC57_12035 [Candidatus Limnocylindrales bacterium]|nr:hypothetical protein [Candidatus Limnocylindrales bacterium]
MRETPLVSAFITVLLACPVSAASPPVDDRLVCFELEDSLAAEERWREVTPGDGSGCSVRTRASLLCTRTKDVEEEDAQLAREQLCYKLRCAGAAAAGPLWLEDAFGGRRIEPGGFGYVCTPAHVSPAGDAGEHGARATRRPRSSGSAGQFVLRECGDFSGEGAISASDALGTLRAAVGSASCLPCVCDVDSSGTFTASDALRVLRNAVGQAIELNCQPDGNPVSWTGGADNVSWHLPGNWSLGTRIPNLCDDVTIAIAGPTILHSQGNDGALRINSTRPIDLSGGTLQVRDTVFVGNTFRFVGGTLKDGIVLAAAPAASADGEGSTAGAGAEAVFTNSGGLLDGVTFEADMNLSATSVHVRVMNDLMLEGTATMGSASNVRFQGGTQLLGGSGEVFFNGTSGKSITVDSGTTLDIGADMTIRGGTGTVGSAGTLTNLGTIHSDLPGEIIVQSTSGWTNAGLIRGSGGGDVELTGTWTNAAQVEILDSGVLTLTGQWHNDGTISSTDSTVNLGGTFTLDDLGTFTRDGGEVNLTGTLDNDTGLMLDDLTGSWRLVGGTILGGTIAAEGNAELIATNSGGLLDGVTLLSGMDMTATSAHVRVSNDVELGPAAVVTMGTAASIRFQGGDQELAGEGEIFFQGTTGKAITIDAGTSVDIGADVIIRGGQGTVGSSGSLTNHGLIHSDLPGEITITSTQGWTNEGSIQGSGGGDLELSGVWTNNSEVAIADSGVLTLEGMWSNAGTIDAVDSTVNLGGTFTLAALGDFSRSGGIVNLTGTFDNVSDLVLGPDTGDWFLRGGTVLGGSIDGTGGARLILTNSGGVLNAVTMLAPMDMTATSSQVRIQNGLQLEGLATMGTASSIRFQGGQQTLSGAGEVFFQGTTGKSITIDSGTTLTIAETMTIRGGQGTVGSSGMLVHEGLIDANGAGEITVTSTQGWTNNGEIRGRDGGDLQLSGVWTNNEVVSMEDGGVLTMGGTWENEGKIISDQATVNLGGTFTLASLGSFSRTGGTVNITGTFDNETDLLLDMSTGSWRLAGGTIAGGSVDAQDGAELLFTNSGGLLDGVTMDAPMNLTGTSSQVRVQNGLVLNDVATMGTASNIRFQGGQQVLEGTGEVHFSGTTGKSITVDSGGTLTVAETMSITGGTGTIGSAGMLQIDGMVEVSESGEITVAATQGWVNDGTLRATAGNLRLLAAGSNSGGTIEIGAGRQLTAPNGFTQLGGGTLVLHLGSAASFGKVAVTGAANLAGTLEVALGDGFDPPVGTTFQIMTFGSRVGDFTTVEGLDIGNGKKLQRTTTATTMTLEVVPE